MIAVREEIQITQMLKGVAILAVFILHVFSSIQPSAYSNSPSGYNVIFFDQFLRFCVPVFLALSGFALSRKYQSNFRLSEFFSNRVLKLLPMYFFWTLIYILLFRFVPAWKPDREYFTLFEKIVFGRADYQLYFVPLIFQLYLLFPSLLFFLKKKLRFFLIFSLIIQSIVLLYIELIRRELISSDLFITDQEQYLFAGSWIFYFCLGMFLGYKQRVLTLRAQLFFALTSFLSFLWTFIEAKQFVMAGVDPIFVLGFTRFSVMLYSSSVIILTLCSVQTIWKFSSSALKSTLTLLGKYSYHIFLSHTLLLRVIFSTLNQTFSMVEASLYTALFIALFLLSKKIGEL